MEVNEYVFSKNNSFKIEYIKVKCPQINACTPTTSDFDTETIAVMYKGNLSYENPTLDIHM